MADHFIVSNPALGELLMLDPTTFGQKMSCPYDFDRNAQDSNFVSVVPAASPQEESQE